MKIYIVRHGQAYHNLKDRDTILPDSIVRLTPEGKKEADDVGVYLKQNIGKYDAERTIIISSTYFRAKQTANILNEHLGLKIFYDRKLREYERGVFGKYTFKDCERIFPEQFKKFKEELYGDNKFYAQPPKGESAADLYKRIMPFKEKIELLESVGIENLIIVSHSGAMRVLTMVLMGYDENWYNHEKNMQNCSVRGFELKNGQYYDFGYIYKGYKTKKTATKEIQLEENKEKEN